MTTPERNELTTPERIVLKRDKSADVPSANLQGYEVLLDNQRIGGLQLSTAEHSRWHDVMSAALQGEGMGEVKEILNQIYKLIMDYHTAGSTRPWKDVESDLLAVLARHRNGQPALNEAEIDAKAYSYACRVIDCLKQGVNGIGPFTLKQDLSDAIKTLVHTHLNTFAKSLVDTHPQPSASADAMECARLKAFLNRVDTIIPERQFLNVCSESAMRGYLDMIIDQIYAVKNTLASQGDGNGGRG